MAQYILHETGKTVDWWAVGEGELTQVARWRDAMCQDAGTVTLSFQ